MLSKRYIPTNIESLNYESNLVKHYSKLEEIQKEDRKKKNVDKEVAEKAKFTESREKAIKFHISERTNAIEKDNELLLGRLVEISRKKPGVLASVKSDSNLPRTLNGPSRRREKNRIAAENEAFARRLLSQQPSFNPKKLELDYEKHHQRVKNMAKLAHFASPGRVKLPPIKYADVELAKENKKTKNTTVKKEQKKKVDDVKVDAKPKEVSPVKAESKEDLPVKSVVVDNQPVKSVVEDNQPVKSVVVDNKPVSNNAVPDSTVDNQETLNKPVEDQKPATSVNVDNKSQVLPENQDNQGPVTVSNQQVDNNNNAPNSAVVDPNAQENKPVEEVIPNEVIQDDTKQE